MRTRIAGGCLFLASSFFGTRKTLMPPTGLKPITQKIPEIKHFRDFVHSLIVSQINVLRTPIISLAAEKP